jgi:virginiamycin B lyase
MRRVRLGAFAAAALLTACSAATPPSPTATPSFTATPEPSPSPSPQPSPLALQDIEGAGAMKLEVANDPDWVTVAGGSAWIAAGTEVRRFDATTAEPLGSTTVPGEICLAMDAGFDSLWVGSCTGTPALTRIDLATGETVATIALDRPPQYEGSVAAGADAVWVVTEWPNPQLIRIDPTTNSVTDAFPIDGTASGVRASADALWIPDPNTASLRHVDPATGQVLARVSIGQNPVFLAVDDTGVWVMNNGDGSVSHVDPATDEVVATMDVGGAVDGGDIAVGGGFVWARVTDGLLVQIDPATNAVVARYGPRSGSGSVGADRASVWISAHDVSAVWRLSLPIDAN